MKKEEELKNPKFLEIKFYRLTSPLFNYSNIPLSGLYNPLFNNESKEYPLNSKFNNFDIASTDFINAENLLSISKHKSERALLKERMENILTFINNSREELTIKDLKITLKSYERQNKQNEKSLELNIGSYQNEIIIPAKKSHSIFFNIEMQNVGKFQLHIYCHSLSPIYDNTYFKLKQRNDIKKSTLNYFIKENTVEFFEFRKINLEIINPFLIKEKIYNYDVNHCFISIKIKNLTDTYISILDLFLTPKGKLMNHIPFVKSLEEIKNQSSKNNKDSKYISLQTQEELMVLFRIDDPDLFYEKNEFILNITWLKAFDFNPKIYKYEFANSLNTFNEYYKMTITEKPEGDIILNQNFKIIINLKSKNKERKYTITLSQEQIQDNDDKSTDREIEIIDIIEKKMELSPKNQTNNFIIICKSDILGNVYLPKLKFTVYEGDKNIPREKVYDSLLSFNCVPK